MIMDQPVNTHDDLRKVTQNILRDAGSRVEMSKTPQFWDDPMLYMPGSCKPEWLRQ